MSDASGARAVEERDGNAARGTSKAKNFRFPVRRSRRVQSKAEIEANRRLIENFIATKGVTRCPPGYANGALQSRYDFV